MHLPHLFARRYLFSPASRSVVNLIAGLSVVSVAVPVAAMILLLSVFNGFGTLIRETQSAFDPGLTVTPAQGRTFDTAAIDTAALRRLPGIGATGCILEQSILLERDGRTATATLRGVDDAYGAIVPLAGAVAGDARVRIGDLDRLLVGQAMAYRLGIRTLADADATLYAVRRGTFSSLLPFENYTRRTVPAGGIFRLDLQTERTYVLSSLRLAQELFGHPGRASALVVGLRPGTDPATAKRAVERALGPDFRVRTAEELHASFYRIMRYEKWAVFCIAFMVLVVASFTVVGALAMLIVEKRRDIATLRTLGADTRLLRAVFRREGLLICLLGAAAGVVLGVGASLAQQHLGLVELPSETFLTKSYPVEFRPGDLAAVLAAFAALAAALTNLTVHSMVKADNRR